MDCPKCSSGMERINEPGIERYECWICGKIVYDPVPIELVPFEAADSLPVCCNCATEFQPTARNQIYCEDCRPLRSKPSSSFERLQEILQETIYEVERQLKEEDIDLLVSQVRGYPLDLEVFREEE